MANRAKRNATGDTPSYDQGKQPVKKVRIQEDTNPPSDNDYNPNVTTGEDEQGDSQAIEKTVVKLNTVVAKFKKKDDWPKVFGEVLDQKEATLLKVIEEVREKITSDKRKFDEELARLLQIALSAISPIDAVENHKDHRLHVTFTSVKGQPFCEGLANLVAKSEKLFMTYNKLAEQEPEPSRLEQMNEIFTKDKDAVMSTIQAAKLVAAYDVECLMADRHHEVRSRSTITTDDQQKGRLLLSKGCSDNQGEKNTTGFGNVAYNVQKVVRRLSELSRPVN